MSIRGHAICVPFPAQGHINPMLQLAKLLHTYGFHITFVNSIYNHNRFLRSRGPHSLEGLPNFRFESIPDGLLPPSEGDTEATQDIPALCRSTGWACLKPTRDLIERLDKEGPRVTCIVTDGVMPFAMQVAEEFGIPRVAFWTMSGCGYLGYVYYRTLADRGFIPLKDSSCLTNGYLDTQVELPGMNNIRLRDFPSFIRTTDQNDFMFNFMADSIDDTTSKASAIVLNTFDSLEQHVTDSLNSMNSLPPIYTIGPLELLVDQIIPMDDSVRSISSSLWTEEPGCIVWLDKKEPNSVVYVNFGSITTMSKDQLIEFAWGLANSKKHFLWVIRPDIVRDENMCNSPVLPEEFMIETKERGMLASWCPQKKVLKHQAIGGFLTHSGWNSTLESICGGVPMISWPFFAEQQTNCRYNCVEWGIGMDIGSEVKRCEIEKLVRALMDEKKGKELGRRTMEWKNKAEEAAKGGSSYNNLLKLIDEVLVPKS